jgi:hypothetical protein
MMPEAGREYARGSRRSACFASDRCLCNRFRCLMKKCPRSGVASEARRIGRDSLGHGTDDEPAQGGLEGHGDRVSVGVEERQGGDPRRAARPRADIATMPVGRCGRRCTVPGPVPYRPAPPSRRASNGQHPRSPARTSSQRTRRLVPGGRDWVRVGWSPAFLAWSATRDADRAPAQVPPAAQS